MKKIVTETLWMAAFTVVPFAYSGEVYEGATLPKLLLFQFILAAICVVQAYRMPEIPAIQKPLLWALGCFALLHVVSIAIAINPTETLLQLSQHIGFLLVPLLAATLTMPQRSRITSVAAWASLPIALIGLAQYLGWGFEWIPSNASPSATFYHRNAAAAYIITIIPFGVVGFLQSKTNRSAINWVALITILGAFLVCTRTRAAWVALIAAGMIVGIIALLTPQSAPVSNKRTKQILTAVAIALIALSALLPEQIQGARKQRFDEKKSDAMTAVSSIFAHEGDRGRFAMWGRTLALIADHPLGVGLGNWQFAYPHYARGIHVNIHAAPERPHNDLLWIASELGLIGLASFLIILLLTAQTIPALLREPQTRDLTLGFSAVVVAYIVDGLFSFPRAQIMPTFGFWFAIGGLANLRANSPQTTRAYRIIFSLAIAVMLCAIVITVQRIQYDIHHLRVHTAERAQDWAAVKREAQLASQYGRLRANTFIALGRAHHHTGNPQGALEAYEIALQLHPHSLNAYNNQGIAFRQANQPHKAEIALKEAIALYPGFTEAYYNLGLVYLDMQRWPESIDMFTAAQKRGLRIPPLFFNLARAFYANGQLNKAREMFEQTLQQDPNFEPARMALIQLGFTPSAPSKSQTP